MKYTQTLILILGTIFFGFSQEYVEDFIPTTHSPEVSSFAKFLEFPVSLYTGQAEVSVPIYNLEVGDITVPISLQYHTGGVRVEDISSWVGSNWSLNAGGQISRQINGHPDFSGNGIFFYVGDPSLTLAYNVSTGSRPDYTHTEADKRARNSRLSLDNGSYTDTEHDIFYYSAGNYSGKFVIDFENNNEPITIPKEDILIELGGLPTWNIPNNGAIIKITTPNGLIYTYGKQENNIQLSSRLGSSPSFNLYDPLAWFLTKIESTTTNAFVDFNYEDKSLIYTENSTHVDNKYRDFSGQIIANTNNDIRTHRLTSIKSSDGQVITFNKGAERKDMLDDYLLDNIIISNINSSLYKQFNLKYKYQKRNSFYDINDPIITSISKEDESESVRLFLMGVEQVDEKDNVIPISDYTYNLNRGLPSRRSFAQDHFGYYNGVTNNESLIPAAYLDGEYYDGADRNPNEEYALEGSLASITTGTGGIRNYTYALNRCSNCNNSAYVAPINDNGNYIIENTDSLYSSLQHGEGSHILEKTFSMKGQGEIIFDLVGSVDYCIETNLGCGTVLKLFSLNDDGSEDILIFNSQDKRFGLDDSSSIYVTEDFQFDGDYKFQLTLNNSDWLSQTDEFKLTARAIKPYVFPPLPEGGRETSGLRVESIELKDPVTNGTINRSYEYGNGYMNGKAKYEYAIYNPVANTGPGGDVVLQEKILLGYVRSSASVISNTKTKGGVVGYDKVTVRETGNGYTENYYYSPLEHQDKILSTPETVLNPGNHLPAAAIADYLHSIGVFNTTIDIISKGNVEDASIANWMHPYAMKDEKDWKRGILKSQTTYKEDGTLLKTIQHKYKFYDRSNTDEEVDEYGYNPYYDPSKIRTVSGTRSSSAQIFDGDGFRFNYYQLQSSWYDMDQTIETEYYEDGSELVTTTKYEYSENQRTIKTTSVTNSKNEVIETTNLFPTDFDNSAMANEMIDKNILSKPLEVIQKYGDDIISEVHNTYEENNDNISLVEVNTYIKANTDDPIKINIDYNEFGNTTEVLREDGVPVSYLWGYSDRFPVAKIENATYDSVTALLSTTELEAIEEGSYSESQMRSVLNKIRIGLPNAMVTTYTYDPLVGVTSITDPRGYTMYYEYDGFQRLEYVKDGDGNLLSKNEYNYKN